MWKANRKNLLFSFIILLIVACSSRGFLEMGDTELEKVDEYDSKMLVKEVEESPIKKASQVKVAKDLKKSSKDEAIEPQIKASNLKKEQTKSKTKPVTQKKSKLVKSKESKKEVVKKNFRRPKVDPFVIGEEIRLEISYFGVTAGYMGMKVKPMVEVNGKQAYHFMTYVESSESFKMFYEVDDWAETFMDYEEMVPYNYATHIKETKQNREIRCLFDHEKLMAFYWDKKQTEDDGIKKKKYDWKIAPFSQNVISSWFYLRTFDMKVGSTIKFPLSDDKKNMLVEAKVLRKENIKTKVGSFKTVVVQPHVAMEGMFKPVGDIFLWFTDDEHKQIVKLEAKIKIGSLKASLVKIVR